MILKNEHHTFAGMQKDLVSSKHPSAFLSDALNVRLTQRDGETLLAITNEKGTSDTRILISGNYLGHCLLNNFLVVFSKGEQYDYIERIDLSDTPHKIILYTGHLNFNMAYPIEAVGSYENSNIQKVYWTDGLNQPRMINIVGNIKEGLDTQFDFIEELQLGETVSIKKQLDAAGSFPPGVIQYAFTYYNKYGQESNIFYTSPLLYTSYKDRGGSPEDKCENAFKITVSDCDTHFDYLRIYSIQRTSINGTPIVRRVQDISLASKDSTTATSVYSASLPVLLVNGNKIPLGAVYSLHYTESIDGHAGVWYGYSKGGFPSLIVETSEGQVTWGNSSTSSSIMWISDYGKDAQSALIYETNNADDLVVENLSLSYWNSATNPVSFIDDGIVGNTIDPAELLYKGGESIVAGTMEQKDGTLFFGDIELKRPQIVDAIREDIKGTVITQSSRTFYPTQVSAYNYTYANQLTSSNSNGNSVSCGGFKRGDYYRCGVQFQYKDGRWGDPIFIKDVLVTNAPSCNDSTPSVTVPTLTGTISQANSQTLLALGYKKARAVVVFPEMQDRVVISQGVVCPTLQAATNPYYQSSWFFRPNLATGYTEINSDGTAVPKSAIGSTLVYTNGSTRDTSDNPTWNPASIRQAEIQGEYDADSKFYVRDTLSTFHSPDIEFDDSFLLLDYVGLSYRKIGTASFTSTFSDISIQTDTPTISSGGSGILHRHFTKSGPYGIVAGLFYDDFIVDDVGSDFQSYADEKSPLKWLVYPWNRTGSLNNDVNRAADKRARTSILKKKILSNLRYATTSLSDSLDNIQVTAFSNTPQIFDSDQISVVKLGNNMYQGNIDTLLSPEVSEGMYFAFNDSNNITAKTTTGFNANILWKTFNKDPDNVTDSQYTDSGAYIYNGIYWERKNTAIGADNLALVMQKETVRMKYKSSPHLVLSGVSLSSTPQSGNSMHIVEILREGTDQTKPFYRETMFGGNSEDALKANNWIPCGEPVALGSSYDGTSTGGATKIQYSYGDTYFQRWDCLKTYPFTPEDINQIVEIGSFMLETRVNIDGRYDRNRGQSSNLNMHPKNFNLYNPVYSQVNNFFTYKILDRDYYTLNSFSNQITWTKEKQAGADTDNWTNITLASTYDLDGSKGKVVSLNVWKDNIFCFQEKGISNILFNSRVQIPTSDGVPIEISNSYKVDGYRYLSDGIGCINKWAIKVSPTGIYFIDSVSNNLYNISEGLTDVSTSLNMSSWFKKNTIDRLLYDDVNHDVYAVNSNIALCYSEILSQFTSFMSYENVPLMESYRQGVFALKNDRLFKLFSGQYNDFFGTYNLLNRSTPEVYTPIYKPWNISFISNGLDEGLVGMDKIFTNIDYRMDFFDNSNHDADVTFDWIRAWDEYQDTQEVTLNQLSNGIGYKTAKPYPNGNPQKKFRIWRIQIPRAKKLVGSTYVQTNDRIRNPWCSITLGKRNNNSNPNSNNLRAILHDLNVQFYL